MTPTEQRLALFHLLIDTYQRDLAKAPPSQESINWERDMMWIQNRIQEIEEAPGGGGGKSPPRA